jgi:hypothetical protein
MSDRFHADAYTGNVHDRSDSLANDAWVAFTRLVKSGRTTVSTDRSERGAVPTIRHATRPDLYAQVWVDRYYMNDMISTVAVGVLPTTGDQLRTSVMIILDDAGSLFEDDASEEDVAGIVLETAAIHLGKAIQRHLDAVPDAERSDGWTAPENRYSLKCDEARIAKAIRDASIATIGADDRTDARISLPTPWNPMRAHTNDRDVETDAGLAARIDTALFLSTSFTFSDGNGRGTSCTIKIKPVMTRPTVVGPMERLRAMNDVRNAAATA